jgi:hypothetical protein
MNSRAIISELSGTILKSAVKALFRHLNDVRSLRRNPIVAHFFETEDRLVLSDDRAILESICQVLLEAARSCRGADAAAGNGRKADDQFAIVVKTLEGTPMQKIASSLNLSLQYCYRQRAALGERMARYIQRRYGSPATKPVTNCCNAFTRRRERVARGGRRDCRCSVFRGRTGCVKGLA